MTDDASRREFEEWQLMGALSAGLGRDVSGEYTNGFTQGKWAAWLASRIAPQARIAELEAALAKADKALAHTVPWVENGPAGSWQDGVLAEVQLARAALASTRGSRGGEK